MKALIHLQYKQVSMRQSMQLQKANVVYRATKSQEVLVEWQVTPAAFTQETRVCIHFESSSLLLDLTMCILFCINTTKGIYTVYAFMKHRGQEPLCIRVCNFAPGCEERLIKGWYAMTGNILCNMLIAPG